MTGPKLPAKPYIVLDRDGVINHDSSDYIKSSEEWQPLAGSLEAISRLYRAGFRFVVATNQSGLARELFTESDLEQMHQKMGQLLEGKGGVIEAIAFCPHHPDADCGCRKPRTGLLEQLETLLQVSLKNSFFLGDSPTDIEAAKRHGCIPVLVRTGKGNKSEEALREKNQLPELVFDSLDDFANWLLSPDVTAKP